MRTCLVTDVSLPRQTVSGRERITPTARVSCAEGAQSPREVNVSLVIDGQEIQQQSVTMAPDAATAVSFQPFTVVAPTHERDRARAVRRPQRGQRFAQLRTYRPGRRTSVLDRGRGRGGERRMPASSCRRALEISDDGRFRVSVRRASTDPAR